MVMDYEQFMHFVQAHPKATKLISWIHAAAFRKVSETSLGAG